MQIKKWLEKKKEAKQKIKKAYEKITDLYKELKKWEPSHIVSDRIKSEINRIKISSNDNQIYLLSQKIYFMYFIISVLSLIFILSLLTKPKIIITLNVVVTGISIIFIGTIITILLKHFLSKEDRKAKRKKDLAEAEYFTTQIKK